MDRCCCCGCCWVLKARWYGSGIWRWGNNIANDDMVTVVIVVKMELEMEKRGVCSRVGLLYAVLLSLSLDMVK